MDTRFIEYSSAKICYHTTGNGKPVMLVHGFGEDSAVWDPQVDFLKDACRLIIPDLPGSGQSALLENAGIDEYADVLKAILDKEQVEKCTLLGHSMGGYITLAFAEKYPAGLEKFGLVHSTAFADDEEKKASREKGIAFIEKNGAYEFLKTSIPGLFAEAFTKEHPARIEELVEKGKDFTAEALVQYYRAMIARPDRTEVLKSFNGPVLFIFGEHDKAIPFPKSLQQSYLAAVSQVHILRESGHMGMWEETELVNGQLKDFIADL
jgi:pimeloyl-ACP methyl ester carboxylesterase